MIDDDNVLRSTGLMFNEFSRTNMQRHLDWPTVKPALQMPAKWTLSDWGIAAAEEMGEVCGAIKRINRMMRGDVVNGKPNDVKTIEEAKLKIKKEIGDTITYLDLLAQVLDSDLEECARLAFNGVSEREGLPHRV